MVGAVRVDVFVANDIAGPDHERRPELRHAFSGLVDSVSSTPRLDACGPCASMQEREPAERDDGSGVCSVGVVVDEDQERRVGLTYERGGVADVAGSDGNDLCAGRGDLVVVVAQLRDMLAAVESAEVAQEHEHCRRLVPDIAEPVRRTVRVGERDVGERGQVHTREA